MEQMMKCPLCGTENKRTYYSEDVGLVEDHYACVHCGYTEEMAYSPRYVGTDTSLADDGVWPSPERMWELVQVEKDGRLVVLPYAIGRVVWVIRSQTSNGENLYLREERIERYSTMRDGTMMCFESGRVSVPHWAWEKTVFLTREEAEAALEGGKD